MNFPHASQTHSPYVFSLETQLGPLAPAYTIAATRDRQYWIDQRQRDLVAPSTGVDRPTPDTDRFKMPAVNPTFAAYSTITAVVVYETEDSDLDDSA
jgi:hypothetical protein